MNGFEESICIFFIQPWIDFCHWKRWIKTEMADEKRGDVRKMSECEDGEKDRTETNGAAKRDVHFTLNVHLYHSVCLYLDSHTALEFFSAYSRW